MFTFLVLVIRFAISVLISFALGYGFTAIALFIAPSATSVLVAFLLSFFVSLWIDIAFNRELVKLSVMAVVSLFSAYYGTVNFVKKIYNSILNFVDHFNCDLFNKKNAIFRVA